uniref:hypothetical protein n=1 Tax=Jatropha curcas TaxID=180498 RepID=UPI0027A7D14D|nr:hypothetical protein QLP06_mgp046 [Jatropha curcas]WFG81193.1 hypothetical protein [Jatropha curcas]
MYGTFNQMRPLIRLIPSMRCFSYDLKSATDRWPLLFLFEVIQCLFDRSFASNAVNVALGYNRFDVPFVRSHRPVCFVAGQPLGYYASWPLFALSHHILMWWCAEQEQAYLGKYFDRYAVLGDDILITDPWVAGIYKETLARLGVKISLSKSLVSSTGCVEFAKRFFVKGMSVDLSPLSVKSLLSFLPTIHMV